MNHHICELEDALENDAQRIVDGFIRCYRRGLRPFARRINCANGNTTIVVNPPHARLCAGLTPDDFAMRSCMRAAHKLRELGFRARAGRAVDHGGAHAVGVQRP